MYETWVEKSWYILNKLADDLNLNSNSFYYPMSIKIVHHSKNNDYHILFKF